MEKLSSAHFGKVAELKSDIVSFSGNRILKKAGEKGTIENVQSFYNQVTLRIGKRNYNVSQNDIKIIG